MPQTELDFIKSLFLDLRQKMETLQTREEAKEQEERLFTELKELKSLVAEQQTILLEHKGHFNTIKIFATTGVASLIAFYSWVVGLIDKK